MTAIDFRFDWLDGNGLRGPELAATFASLRMDVGRQPLTRVFDEVARTVRNQVFVPLYPVAEWLASNWWFMAFEHENAQKKEHPAFIRRHSLGTSTDGYALPDLTIIPSGGRTQVRWGERPPAHTRVGFWSSGSAIVDRDEFMHDCASFIDGVVGRLLEHDICSTFLQDEWAAIQASDEEESSFCEMAAGLGWDPYGLDDDKQKQVTMLADQLGDLREEAVPVIDWQDPGSDGSAIVAAVAAARPNELIFGDILSDITVEDSGRSPAWQIGYRLAQETRNRVGLDGQPLQTGAELAAALNQDAAALDTATAPSEPLSRLRLVDGVVARGASGTVSFGLKARGEIGRRFLFCRALGEAIATHGDGLVTRGTTRRQQRNRAFAAEFLAPSESLRDRITHPAVDGEQVDDLAEEFGVSTQVIHNQIENHKLATVAGT